MLYTHKAHNILRTHNLIRTWDCEILTRRWPSHKLQRIVIGLAHRFQLRSRRPVWSARAYVVFELFLGCLGEPHTMRSTQTRTLSNNMKHTTAQDSNAQLKLIYKIQGIHKTHKNFKTHEIHHTGSYATHERSLFFQILQRETARRSLLPHCKERTSQRIYIALCLSTIYTQHDCHKLNLQNTRTCVSSPSGKGACVCQPQTFTPGKSEGRSIRDQLYMHHTKNISSEQRFV